jgi:hypothetical protein
MAEMDIGFGPGKTAPDLNTQMGGIDPLLQKAASIKTPEEGIGVGVELAGEERRLSEKEAQARIKKEKALPEIEAAYLAEQGKFVKQARTREEEAQADAERAMSEFTVSKDTLGGMATLASVIGVLGSLAGNTGGRQAGLGAIKSMTGMMAGYQKGRADEFRRDQIEFDKQYKILQGKLDRASKEFDRAISMMPYNMAEAQKIKNTALAELNSEIITAVDAKQGITRANTLLKQAVDVANQNLNRANQLKIAEMKAAGGAGAKPAKEIVLRHQAREKLIPALEKGIPILQRLEKEGKWDTLSMMLKADEISGLNTAEYNFKDDREAIELIRILASFRAGEFETAGKALTKKEDAILKPLYQAGIRPFSAMENAMLQGRSELLKEQLDLERKFPYLKNEEGNAPQAAQASQAAPAAPPAPKQMPTGPRLKSYADANFNGDEQAAKDYLATQGYQ